MKDLYFLTGMMVGAVVGGICVYKSKKLKETMCECESVIAKEMTESAKAVKQATKKEKENK